MTSLKQYQVWKFRYRYGVHGKNKNNCFAIRGQMVRDGRMDFKIGGLVILFPSPPTIFLHHFNIFPRCYSSPYNNYIIPGNRLYRAFIPNVISRLVFYCMRPSILYYAIAFRGRKTNGTLIYAQFVHLKNHNYTSNVVVDIPIINRFITFQKCGYLFYYYGIKRLTLFTK